MGAAEQVGNGWRLRLRGGEQPAEFVLLSLDGGMGYLEVAPDTMLQGQQGALYRAPRGGTLRALSVFLLGDWVGAKVRWDAARQEMRIGSGPTELVLPLEVGGS